MHSYFIKHGHLSLGSHAFTHHAHQSIARAMQRTTHAAHATHNMLHTPNTRTHTHTSPATPLCAPSCRLLRGRSAPASPTKDRPSSPPPGWIEFQRLAHPENHPQLLQLQQQLQQQHAAGTGPSPAPGYYQGASHTTSTHSVDPQAGGGAAAAAPHSGLWRGDASYFRPWPATSAHASHSSADEPPACPPPPHQTQYIPYAHTLMGQGGSGSAVDGGGGHGARGPTQDAEQWLQWQERERALLQEQEQLAAAAAEQERRYEQSAQWQQQQQPVLAEQDALRQGQQLEQQQQQALQLAQVQAEVRKLEQQLREQKEALAQRRQQHEQQVLLDQRAALQAELEQRQVRHACVRMSSARVCVCV